MDIAFNFNIVGLEGLGSTLTSLIRNCSDSQKITLWFLCSDILPTDKINIKQLLDNENFTGKINFIDFDAKKSFGELRPLHGDWSAYGRLLIPSKIDRDIVLYLDCDLIILTDILELSNFNFSDRAIAAVYGSKIEDSFDKDLFINELKWPTDIGYFNSGVILFNNKKWKEDNYDSRIKELCHKFPNHFLAADQTILNAVLKGNFKYLDAKYNMAWPPRNKQPENSEKGIIHFVGSPKPWDLFGKSLHHGIKVWQTYHTPFWKKCYGALTLQKLVRTWHIRRSIIRHFGNKFA
ncbi:hypothetical protein MHTCC0001_18400 [Flavobacteriaceae bacterium MHTCC 0001]